MLALALVALGSPSSAAGLENPVPPEGMAGARRIAVNAVVPRSFDFRSLPPAVPGESLPIKMRPEHEWRAEMVEQLKAHPPELPVSGFAQFTLDTSPAGAAKGSFSPLAPTPGNGFEGISQAGFIPGEPTVAGGPLNIFTCGNVSVTVTNKDGTGRIQIPGTFFFGVGANETFVFDPQCFYDALRGRFLALCLTEGTSPSNFSNIYLAISKTNDARGQWWLYKFDMTKDGTTATNNWADYEGLGLSDDKIVFSSQQLSFGANAYQYQKFRIIDRAAAYSGATLSYTDIFNFPAPAGDVDDNFVTKPARNLTAGDSTVYCLCVRIIGGNHVTFRTISGPPTGPVLSAGQTIDISAYSPPPDAVQQGSSLLVNTGSCQPPDFYTRSGVLIVAWHTAATIGGTSVSAIRLLRLRLSDRAVLTDETFGQPSTFYYYPAATVDSVGTVFLGCDRSSSTEYPSAWATGKRRGEVTLEPSALLKAGVTPTSQSRWGDYTGIDMDASLTNPGLATAWYAGQWAKLPTLWGTWINRLTFTYGQVFGTVAEDCDESTGTTGDRVPIAGVTVALNQGVTTVASTTTDASGQYSFGYLESGTYDVVVTAPAGGTNVDAVAGSGGTSQTRVNAGDVQIVMTNEQSSSANNFLVASTKPLPATASIFPSVRVAGDPQFSLIVNGSGFSTCSVVRIDGSDRATTFVNSGQLTAVITVADQSAAGTKTITVFAPVPGGGTSNGQTFTITGTPDVTPPVVTITSPLGGESWSVASLHNITWTAIDDIVVANVDLALSTDGGASFPTSIATGIANSGTFAWTLPGVLTTQARVRVLAHDGAGNLGSDSSHANFAITGWTLALAIVGGGSVTRTPNQPSYLDGSAVQLTAVPTAGWTFSAWSGDLMGNTNPSNLLMDADKSVTSTFLDVQAPAVAVTSPNGTEVLMVAASAPLTWTATDNNAVTGVDLDLSRSGADGPFESIASGIANSGTFSWNVTGPPTTNAFLRVTGHDAATNSGQDLSDAAFAISDGITGVDDPIADFALSPVWPNPVHGSTRFQFAMPMESSVHLGVHDIQGRELLVLADGPLPAGRHSVGWSSSARTQLDPGLYFVRFTVAGRSFVRRFALVR